jgi:hypothetical protein
MPDMRFLELDGGNENDSGRGKLGKMLRRRMTKV